MQLSIYHRKQIMLWYCIIFYILMVYKWWNGLFLYQLKPYLFNNRLDFFTWLLMKTGIHQIILNNEAAWLVSDVAFYSMPLLMYIAYVLSVRNVAAIVSILMLIVNWIYIQCYTLYPTNSIESYLAWLLFPFMFITINQRSFYFMLHGLRYYFLFFFASAGLWKIVQQGAFNLNQMSGVLLVQHKEYLTSSATWYSAFIYWVIQHPLISYLFYLLAMLLELTFIIGFFTKKFDRYLIAGFLLFLFMDYFIMRISYLEMSAFILPLVYSRFQMPDALTGKR